MTALTGILDTGRIVGGPTPGSTFHMIGADGKRYVIWLHGGSVRVGDCDDNTAVVGIDNTRFNTDAHANGVSAIKTFGVSQATPCKNQSVIWVFGLESGVAFGDPVQVVGIKYRIDGPSSFTYLNKMVRNATNAQSTPDGSGRGTHGAYILNDKLYAAIAAGTFFPDTMNGRLIAGIPMTGDDVDTSAGSWDAICPIMPFDECQVGTVDGGVTGADVMAYAKVSVFASQGGIGVGFRVGNEYKFTEYAPIAGTFTAVNDIGPDIGLPFADEGIDWLGNPAGDSINVYRCANIDGADGEEHAWLRSFTNGPNEARMQRFSFDKASNTFTFLDETTFTYTNLNFYRGGGHGLVSRSGVGDLVDVCLCDDEYFIFGGVDLPAPVVTPGEPEEEDPLPEPIALVDGGREPTLRTRLVNMYSEPTPKGPSEFSRYQRPGLYEVASRGAGPIRATFPWNDYRFTVSGSAVYRDSTNIGLITGTGPARFAFSDEEVVIVSGGRAWLVSLTTVTQISDPDLPDGVIDVVFLAGRFVYVVDSDMQFRWSALGDASTIDGLSFATAAENTADKIVGVAVLADQLVFFTRRVIEWWYPQDDITAPYKRSLGRKNDQGLASRDTLVLTDNTLMILGYDKIVYRLGAVPLRISDFEVEDWLRRATIEELADAYAFQVVFGGHTFYVLFIPGFGSWAYDIVRKEWAEWKSFGKDRFRVFCADENFLGDYYSGKIMGLDGAKWVDLDDDPIERVTSAYVPVKRGRIPNPNVCLRCIRGVGLPTGYGSDPVVEMRFSDDENHTWSNWMEATLGQMGEREDSDKAIWYSLGSIRAPGRGFEFRCTDPVKWSPYEIVYNQANP